MVRCQKLFGRLQCDSDAEHLREYFKCINMSAGFWGLLFKYDESSSKPVSFTFFRANHKSYFEKSYFFFCPYNQSQWYPKEHCTLWNVCKNRAQLKWMDISQVFPPYFKLHIALCYVFWLQEMSIKLTYNVLEENYQHLFHIGQKRK